MNKEEVKSLLEYLNSTRVGFKVDVTRSTRAWHRALGSFSRVEVLSALDWAEDNVDGNLTQRTLKAICDRNKKQKEQEERNKISCEQHKAAEASFVNVPGDNRSEKVLFICAERASEHWRKGTRDNELFNDLLIKAKLAGIEFNGVDYSNLTHTGIASDWLPV